jgi:dipeptidyl aminopeptidase/acylaminoacyl peptidase
MPTSAGPEIVNQQVVLEAFSLLRDGSGALYVRRDVARHAYRSHLWQVPVDGGRPQQLTRGTVRDSRPLVSPQGRRVAFLRRPAEGDVHSQVWILPLDGGEPWRLTDLKHGAESMAWSPDGRRLAVTTATDDLRFIVGSDEKGKAPRARRITRLDFRGDEAGHRDRRSHLFVLSVRAGARPRQLTRGDYEVSRPVWSPDGTSIAFVADRQPDADLHPHTSIWSIPAEGGSVHQLVALRGDADRPAYSPDGRWLAFMGTDVEDAPEHEPVLLWVMPAAGGAPRALTEGLDRPVGGWSWSDLDLAHDAPGPTWLDDDTLLFLLSHRARVVPHRVRLSTGTPEALTAPDRLIASGIEAATGRIVISAAIGGRAGELYAVEDGGLRQITRQGSAWQRRYQLPELEELEIAGPGGAINSWLASPPDAGEGQLPLIVHLHGGPTGAFGPGSTLDGMVLTGAGYRVAMPNIRGSASFGYDWAHALQGRWGVVDTEDVLAVIDHLVESGLADPQRLGVIGLSYGGFLVQWLLGTTDRFAAAVAENGVANQVSAWGNSYFGAYWSRREGLGDPLSEEGMLRLWRGSPLANVKRITTPLLMLQAEEDLVCPAADNEQLFTALRVLGRQVEYILYPEEHHEMKNDGRPDRRIDRYERILEWFARWFAVAG